MRHSRRTAKSGSLAPYGLAMLRSLSLVSCRPAFALFESCARPDAESLEHDRSRVHLQGPPGLMKDRSIDGILHLPHFPALEQLIESKRVNLSQLPGRY